jgi:hypothetical protein
LFLTSSGTRDAGNGVAGACGISTSGGAFACNQAAALTVQQLSDGGWVPFASWNGQMSVTAQHYNEGFAAIGADNWSAQCSLYDAYPGWFKSRLLLSIITCIML